MASLKIVKVKSWDELPEILEPGEYEVDGVRITIAEALPREVVERHCRLGRMLAEKYGSSA
ncbi:MAG: hypothetical protein GXO09_05090 [Crenarchaeota archaeon]|nr:hypothetical protein [Thermoproteota archaeon]